jgi:hypothetical protein
MLPYDHHVQIIIKIAPYHAKHLKWTCPSFNLDKTIHHL